MGKTLGKTGFGHIPIFLLKETMAPRSPGEERFAVGLGGDAPSMWIRPRRHVTGPRGLTPGDQKMWGTGTATEKPMVYHLPNENCKF